MVALEYYLVCLHLDSSRQDARTCLCRCVCVCVCVMMIVIVVVYGCACMQCYLLSLFVQYLCTCIAHAKLRGRVYTGVCACVFCYLSYSRTTRRCTGPRPPNTLQHTAQHVNYCNTLQHTGNFWIVPQRDQALHGANASEHTATRSNTIQ